MNLPESIARLLPHAPLLPQNIGMSGAEVWYCGDLVLKIEPIDRESDNNLKMLRWLRGKLPVPGVLGCTVEEGRRYLLMDRLPGEMACEPGYLRKPAALVKLLAQGLRMLWSVDITGCPGDQRAARKLENARYQVEHKLYDLENVEPDTFGPGGFGSPEELLSWLEEHRPEEDLVLSHGDYCLPNVFFREEEVSGFLDLGRCGVADRYADIALCWRSLRDNFNGAYGCFDPDFDPDELFRELGIQPDWDKIRWFLLMDELF